MISKPFIISIIFLDPYSGQNVSGGFINMQIGTNVPPYPANSLQVEAPQNRPLNQQPSS